MFLIVRADGKFWNGHGWAEKGREFFSIAYALRSLHEEGEDFHKTRIIEITE